MTDEMMIEQKRPSALPYMLGGGIVLGGGTALAATQVDGVRKLVSTPAKYNSYDDLINEKEDEFKKAVDNATGDEKASMEKAVEARKAASEAGAKWDADLKAYQDAYKSGEPKPLAEDHELLKKQKDLQTKIANLEKETAAGAVSTANSERLSGELIEKQIKLASEQRQVNFETKLNGFAQEQANLLEKIDAAKATGDRATEKALLQEYKQLENKIRTSITEEVTAMYPEKTGASKKAINRNKRNIQSLVDDSMKYIDITREGLAQEQPIASNAINKQKAVVSRIKSMMSEGAGTVIERNKDDIAKLKNLVERSSQSAQHSKNLLTLLQNNYQDILKDETATIEKQWKFLFGVLSGKEVKIPNGVTSNIEEVLSKMDQKDQATIRKVLSGEITEEGLQKAISAQETRIKDLNEILSKDIAKLEEIISEEGGKGARIENGQLVDKAGKQVTIKGKKVDGAPKASVELPKVSRQEIVEGLKKQNAETGAITKEQLAAKTKDLESARAELKGLDAEIQKAREALGKNPEKTVEQLTQEFIEKNGKREDVVKKAADKYKDELKKLFEGKLGAKFWVAIAAMTAVGAGIGSLLRPKAKEA